MKTDFASSCPIPFSGDSTILLAHGGGGRLMHQLIETVFLRELNAGPLRQRHDGAVIETGDQRLAFTTDSYVIRPLFFPGGDIGSLAVNGTVNDLAMCGARPRWLSAAFIMEEGLPMETLGRVVRSMQCAATAAGVEFVTGDTKVVDKGKGDSLFINTAGIGVIDHPLSICPASVRSGDAILLSGDLGRHGMAIMSVREGLEFDSTIESDCAPLAEVVMRLLDAGIQIHCLRDLTRGGLTSALNEIAEAARVQMDIDEKTVPITESVQGACEILGLDPLAVANEGRFVAFIAPEDPARALEIIRSHPVGVGAQAIGVVREGTAGLVTLKSSLGTTRILDMLSGEQLPRIC